MENARAEKAGQVRKTPHARGRRRERTVDLVLLPVTVSKLGLCGREYRERLGEGRKERRRTNPFDPLPWKEPPRGDAEGVPGQVRDKGLDVPQLRDPVASEEGTNDVAEGRRAAGVLCATELEAVDRERGEEDEDRCEEMSSELNKQERASKSA